MKDLSRNEELLDALLNETELPETKPKSRMEAYLYALCEKGLITANELKEINRILDSDDENLDQLSEIVARVKENQRLIEALGFGEEDNDLVDVVTGNAYEATVFDKINLELQKIYSVYVNDECIEIKCVEEFGSGYKILQGKTSNDTNILIYEDFMYIGASNVHVRVVDGIKSIPIDEKFLPEHSWDNLKNKPFYEDIDKIEINETIAYAGFYTFRSISSELHKALLENNVENILIEGKPITYTETKDHNGGCVEYNWYDDTFSQNTTLCVLINEPKAYILNISEMDGNVTRQLSVTGNYTISEIKKLDEKFIPSPTFVVNIIEKKRRRNSSGRQNVC